MKNSTRTSIRGKLGIGLSGLLFMVVMYIAISVDQYNNEVYEIKRNLKRSGYPISDKWGGGLIHIFQTEMIYLDGKHLRTDLKIRWSPIETLTKNVMPKNCARQIDATEIAPFRKDSCISLFKYPSDGQRPREEIPDRAIAMSYFSGRYRISLYAIHNENAALSDEAIDEFKDIVSQVDNVIEGNTSPTGDTR
jgi:hypothetical protein